MSIHNELKESRMKLDDLKSKANTIAMQRVRIEAEIEQATKLYDSHMASIKEAGYNNIEEVEAAITEKRLTLQNMLNTLDRMVSGQVEIDDDTISALDDLEDLSF